MPSISIGPLVGAAWPTRSPPPERRSRRLRFRLLLGMLQLLETTDLNSEQSEYVHIAGESTDHLLKVINDILDFSKIEAGQMRIHLEEIELEEALEYNEQSELGDELLIEINPKDFDRVSVQSAKQKAKLEASEPEQ